MTFKNSIFSTLLVAFSLSFVQQAASALTSYQDVDASSDSESRAKLAFFEKRIRPILVDNCYECHSVESDSEEGGLLVDSRAGLLSGGDNGAAINLDEPDSSLLLEALRYESLEMPPDQQLPAHVVEDFETWIKDGVTDPRVEKTVRPSTSGPNDESASSHWAFQAPKLSFSNHAQLDDGPIRSIDRLIQNRHGTSRMPAPKRADKRWLIRRAYFDLIGLPPSPQAIDAFLANDATDAWEQLIDQLLASPRFGERWGRHWLDTARYADSSGGGRAILFPLAHQYRRYVIESFNEDKPYDQFVKEQIAGDLMPFENDQERRHQLAALGFLTLGPTNYELQDKELLRMEVVDEQIDTMGRALLGMSIGCAQCHDHKFDPIPTRDYYALAGIFRSTKTLLPGNVSGYVTRELPQSDVARAAWDSYQSERKSLQSQLGAIDERRKRQNEIVAQLRNGVPYAGQIVIDDESANFVGTWVASSSVKPFVDKGYHHSSDKEAYVEFSHELETTTPCEVRLAYTHHPNRASNVLVQIVHATGVAEHRVNQRARPKLAGQFEPLGSYQFSPEKPAIIRIVCNDANGIVIADGVAIAEQAELESEANEAVKVELQEAEKRLSEIQAEFATQESAIKLLDANKPSAPSKVMGVAEEQEIADYYVCIRGNVHRHGEPVERGVLTKIGAPAVTPLSTEQSGRLELAQWLVDAGNPLTARVQVNRIWHHLFGAGIVASLDNFGITGDSPTDLELLDYLALSFIEQGWSTKAMIREIMLSDAYQAESNGAKTISDQPFEDGRPVRRLDAESIRDAILYMSGQLNEEQVELSFAKNLKSEFALVPENNRRSVYLPVFRNNLNELMEAFDFANPNLVSGGRKSTILATQALYLMNSEWVREQADHAARRINALEITDQEKLNHAALSILGRTPTAEENELLISVIESSGSDESEQMENWSVVIQSLLTSLDFRYLK